MSSDLATDAPLMGEPLPVELMNTIWADRTGVYDSLATPSEAGSWLRAVRAHLSLPGGDRPIELAETDTIELRRLRDAARRLASQCTQDPRAHASSAIVDAQEAVATLNASAARAPSWPVLVIDGDRSFSAHSEAGGTLTETLLSSLAAEIIAMFGSDNLELRACLAPGCVLYFVKDHPRREWCSTACGNRARAARHYARHGRNRSGLAD